MRSILIADILLLFFAVYIKHSYQLSYPCNSSAECGCSTNTATVTRIVGGEVAGTSTWGWVVSIKIGIYDGLCGGAIIASQWILTAAHCLSSVTASQITVYAGSDTMWSGQVRTVSVMYIHPNYSSSTYRNDIALLQLSSALNMTDLNVKIACIPSVSSFVLSAGEWPPANVDVSARLFYAFGNASFLLHNRSWPLVGAQRRRVGTCLTLFDKWRWARSRPMHRCAAQSYTIRPFSSVLASHVAEEVSPDQAQETLVKVWWHWFCRHMSRWFRRSTHDVHDKWAVADHWCDQLRCRLRSSVVCRCVHSDRVLSELDQFDNVWWCSDQSYIIWLYDFDSDQWLHNARGWWIGNHHIHLYDLNPDHCQNNARRKYIGKPCIQICDPELSGFYTHHSQRIIPYMITFCFITRSNQGIWLFSVLFEINPVCYSFEDIDKTTISGSHLVRSNRILLIEWHGCACECLDQWNWMTERSKNFLLLQKALFRTFYVCEYSNVTHVAFVCKMIDSGIGGLTGTAEYWCTAVLQWMIVVDPTTLSFVSVLNFSNRYESDWWKVCVERTSQHEKRKRRTDQQIDCPMKLS